MKTNYIKPVTETVLVAPYVVLASVSGPGGLNDSNQHGDGIDPQ